MYIHGVEKVYTFVETNGKMNNKLMHIGSFEITTSKRAFDALLAYERNCIAKYDRPNRPSVMPPTGERMEDFARQYGTTIEDMKKARNDVEAFLEDQNK